MKDCIEMNTKNSAIRIGIIAAISLLLLIPLALIKGIIAERSEADKAVTNDVADSYAKAQTIGAPSMESVVTLVPATDSANMKSELHSTGCEKLSYNATVDTDMLHRSIYSVIVYDSRIEIAGSIPVTDNAVKAASNRFVLEVSDFKGLASLPRLSFAGKSYNMSKQNGRLLAEVQLPEDIKNGDNVDFTVTLNLKGTESLAFQPMAEETTLKVSSSYQHPSFQGTFLPVEREIGNEGFTATWNVLGMNISSPYDTMEVKFVKPGNPYQQAMRSAKYGILIVVLVFAAGLFVELLTRRNINPIQYAIIGLSLVLFYSLLIAFSELITFGVAYTISALMTTAALMLYFKAILKNRSSYALGGFIALVYAANYTLLQMETYALLTGSLLLFVLLGAVMYLTADINSSTARTDTKETE